MGSFQFIKPGCYNHNGRHLIIAVDRNSDLLYVTKLATPYDFDRDEPREVSLEDNLGFVMQHALRGTPGYYWQTKLAIHGDYVDDKIDCDFYDGIMGFYSGDAKVFFYDDDLEAEIHALAKDYHHYDVGHEVIVDDFAKNRFDLKQNKDLVAKPLGPRMIRFFRGEKHVATTIYMFAFAPLYTNDVRRKDFREVYDWLKESDLSGFPDNDEGDDTLFID